MLHTQSEVVLYDAAVTPHRTAALAILLLSVAACDRDVEFVVGP